MQVLYLKQEIRTISPTHFPYLYCENIFADTLRNMERLTKFNIFIICLLSVYSYFIKQSFTVRHWKHVTCTFQWIYNEATIENLMVEKFIGINMQNDINFKNSCLWLILKLFYNRKIFVYANLITMCTHI